MRIGEEQYFARKIERVLEDFVSRRLEGITLQYFHRMILQGKYEDVDDYGSNWYDDPSTRTKGEFDCVLKRDGERFNFYECKYFSRPMTMKECREERDQLLKIKGMDISLIGFVCTGGFETENMETSIVICGEDLYLEV